MPSFESYIPVDIQFGCGLIQSVGEKIKCFGKRAFVITGRNSSKINGTIDKIKESCNQAQVELVIYEHSTNEPSVRFADDAAQIARIEHLDVLIGVGGGVILDLAKAVAVGMSNPGTVWNYTGFESKKGLPQTNLIPLIAIPTTAGSGSHVSPMTFLIHQEKKIKSQIIDRMIFPKISICDPEITLSLNQTHTAYSGFSSFVRAIEGFLSCRSTPLSDIYSREAIRLIHWNLERVYNDTHDNEAREKMLWADLLSGFSNTLAGTGIAHAVANTLHANYKIPYGLALANVLPGVIRFLKEEKIERLRELSYFLAIDTSELKYSDSVERILDSIDKFIFNLGLKRALKDYAVEYDRFRELATQVVQQIPRIIGREIIEKDIDRITNIYKEAF